MRATARLLVLAALVAACGLDSSQGPTPLDGPATLDLMLPAVPVAVSAACRGVGLRAVLHGDPGDPRVAWLTLDDGSRQEVVWPAGYRARFISVGSALVLEIRDAGGRLVIGESDVVTGACTTSDEDVLLLMPPFR